MGSVPVSRSDATQIGLLQNKFGREVVKKLFFNMFTSEVIKGPVGEMVHPGTPIQVLNGFASDGQDKMLLPVLKNLTDAPIYGDQNVHLLGEKQQWDFAKVYINQIQFPLEGPGAMSNQRIKSLNIMRMSIPQLTDKMARWEEHETVSAIYEGWSRNITAAVLSSGYAVTKRYHPNFYVAGSGLATWSGTVQTHANAIGAKVEALSDTASDYFSVDNLESLRSAVQKIPIQPYEIDGKPCYVLLVHHNQMLQLRRDTKWRNEFAQIPQQSSNPIIAAAEAKVANFLIFEREYSVWGMSASNSSGTYTLTFGVTNPLTGLDSYDVKVAVVLGAGALNRGNSGGIRIGQADLNVQNAKEYAIRRISGWSQNTWYDVDPTAATPTRATCQSSALLASWSPDEWT